MWQGASGSVLALSPFFFEVQLVLRSQRCSGVAQDGTNCSAQLTGVALQRERSSAVQEERQGIKWFLYQNLLQPRRKLFSALSPKFEKSVVCRRKKDLEGKLWMCGEQMWGWMLPPDL